MGMREHHYVMIGVPLDADILGDDIWDLMDEYSDNEFRLVYTEYKNGTVFGGIIVSEGDYEGMYLAQVSLEKLSGYKKEVEDKIHHLFGYDDLEAELIAFTDWC